MNPGHLLWILFGPGTWGSGGNMVAWVICGLLAGLWLHGKLKAHEALARLHHQQHMAQAQEHHDALVAHVTATATLAAVAAEPQVRAGTHTQAVVPPEVLDAVRRRP